ncbi:prolyl oligopeptidase family serine peptidase [Luteolibacter pohnpeiensis]|uniref:Prolyl oligopeptidase family serine peptidase n=1 Tax=Luteolibacter pohnpeiensis TaxID=454153 RepID=A0A934S7A5_9BACT|nr:prolyl oligopeptidase family serine peptidase [Luteolibacter pohnpeiensis]MBK1881022.1 prolyl oligopeptidase family serine peptidase [Luteolibacter pohnpeiensis]
MFRILILGLCLIIPLQASSDDLQVRNAMKKADSLGREYRRLLDKSNFRAHWADDDSRLIYQIDESANGTRYYEVDLKSGKATAAFDQELLAKALGQNSHQNVRAGNLPLISLKPVTGSPSIRFFALGKRWQWDTTSNSLQADNTPAKSIAPSAPNANPRSTSSNIPTVVLIQNSTAQDLVVQWVNESGVAKNYGTIPPSETREFQTYAGHVWLFSNPAGSRLASVRAAADPVSVTITGKVRSARPADPGISPDGKWSARIQNNNLYLQNRESNATIPLTKDGSRSHPYAGELSWSPDSKSLVAWRVTVVPERQINIVQSTPPDQLQPKLLTFNYAKPGDEITRRRPVLFDLSEATPKLVQLDDGLYHNPWKIDRLEWLNDSSEFQFLFNARGHQTMRVIGIAPKTGVTRIVLEETSDTFIDYSQKTWMHRLAGSADFLWASERDGYNHLYLIDGRAGKIRKQITSGDWNIHQVDDIQEANGSVEMLVETLGMDPTQPYHRQYARIVLNSEDDVKITRLTESHGNHTIEFSPGKTWEIATWSRPDQAPVTELRRGGDGSLVAELVRADTSAMEQRGWKAPESFVAKGRDGKTDIYGLIFRPSNFDPNKKYPVLENIYAGPHDFFTPQNFSSWSSLNAMAELGFIVVKLDGMGTNWRSKAFHDVAWKNLKDSGFPDRIPWIKAAAESRPWMDLSRVGIYGGSAGGQSALSALLHFGDFYQVAVADCGCHDNRMDKIWWNEAWMGWPVDESYAENSNANYAANLKGDLMLFVGELDHNVDPASTAQVVAALQEAGKVFDFVPVMNAGHGAAETPYGNFRRATFLVHHLNSL